MPGLGDFGEIHPESLLDDDAVPTIVESDLRYPPSVTALRTLAKDESTDSTTPLEQAMTKVAARTEPFDLVEYFRLARLILLNISFRDSNFPYPLSEPWITDDERAIFNTMSDQLSEEELDYYDGVAMLEFRKSVKFK